MVEIPDAAIEAAAFESEIWRCACDRYRSGHDRAECDATARLMARAVLEAATVAIPCPNAVMTRDEYDDDVVIHPEPCEVCNGTGTLRVLRTGETR